MINQALTFTPANVNQHNSASAELVDANWLYTCCKCHSKDVGPALVEVTPMCVGCGHVVCACCPKYWAK
ncbi:hypothetical protein EJ06DRAFT_122983 [Trichodelitschia bisporula]|uniref:Uncharacterized protein n=1 Tax=Trichodelitschia bisporula TaxID=703511 RepID=A0A6G1HPW5_9PEZI|nr:hypothetical protein EJ06DRAFT_122983 [Trichodelitschia bisporula]